MNGSMISYQGRYGLLVLKNDVMFVGMSKKERILLSTEKKLLDGCNPRNQSPGRYCTHFFLQVLQTAIVGIVCLVVHDEFVVHKVETVRSGLVRVLHHLAN